MPRQQVVSSVRDKKSLWHDSLRRQLQPQGRSVEENPVVGVEAGLTDPACGTELAVGGGDAAESEDLRAAWNGHVSSDAH